MPEISDERIQQMKNALEQCGWEFKWEDESGIVFDTGRTENPNKAPRGTRYDYNLYENGTDRIQFKNWEHVQDMIDNAIYHSVEEVAGTAKENYTKEHNGVTVNGQQLEKAMYPDRFDGNWKQSGNEFPPQCFAVDSDTHKLVMIQTGGKGTLETPIQSTNAVDNQVLANKLNARYGVTKDQASEMLYCAKNGWDKETREAWAEQKNNITPEQAEVNAKVEKAESIVRSGEMNHQYGDVSWELDKNGTLTISGTGYIPDYSEGEYPWSKYRESIKNVVIEDGIINVPDYAFENCLNLESVDMPNSVESIGMGAFRNSGLRGDIELPENARVHSYAFTECDKINTVYGKGNTLFDGAFYKSGVKEMRLDECQIKKESIDTNYELKKIVSKGCEFEENSVCKNLNLENVVTEKDHGIENALNRNGETPPKITTIDSQDKTRQGGKYNIGKESIFGHMRRKLRHENKTVDKNAPSREAQKGKSQATDHAME